jgi:hypothetical protein
MPMREKLAFRPLTAGRWNDLVALFGERGACAGCWCMWWRLPHAQFVRQKGPANKRALHGSRAPLPHPPHHAPRFPLILGLVGKKRRESGLLKMPVTRQCLGDALFFHDEKRGTICETPRFVRAFGVKGKRPLELGACLKNDGCTLVVSQVGGETGRCLSRLRAAPGKEAEDFSQHHFARYQAGRKRRARYRYCLLMQSILRIEDGDPVARVSEDGSHSSTFGAP